MPAYHRQTFWRGAEEEEEEDEGAAVVVAVRAGEAAGSQARPGHHLHPQSDMPATLIQEGECPRRGDLAEEWVKPVAPQVVLVKQAQPQAVP